MMNLSFRKFSAVLAIAFALFLSSCSWSDYRTSLPANSTALLSVDVAQLSGVGHSALLEALLLTSDADDGGLDLTQKVYLFETADGMLGLCAAVDDAGLLTETFRLLAQKGRCKPVEERDGKKMTVLGGSWVVAYGDDAVLVAGPVAAQDQPALHNRLIRYLAQDKERSAVGSPMFLRLDSISAPMALVAQAQALPERLSTLLMLGAPRDADASQVLFSAAIRKEDGCLVMQGEAWSTNKRVEAALRKASRVFRPVGNRFVQSVLSDAPAGMFLNVNGGELLPLLQGHDGLQALLAGANAAIDMDNIIRSIDGDMALAFFGLANQFSMNAELSHSQWLADVGYWKHSCPKGTRIDDWQRDAYCYTDGTSTYYFGVSAAPSDASRPMESSRSSLLYYSGTTPSRALAALSAAHETAGTSQLEAASSVSAAQKALQRLAPGHRRVLFASITALLPASSDEKEAFSDDLLSTLLPIFRPLLDGIQMVVCQME